MPMPILAPAAALVLWSMVMLCWVAATRLPALAKLKIPPERTVGGRGSDLDGVLPREIQWKAHNYNHLMEQPTLFYAVVIILALLGHGAGMNLWLAWAYLALRIAHSLWQAIINTIPVRVSLFTLSSIVLLILSINALRAALAV
ncbi:MAPEG family protein [Rhizorhapis sp. SPR117]|uniref:MAPEG family protein n=1 Tax=Rhizorhapis sp. SPR117 TaxID=2912611 RepID=UPI001F338FD3|nr:MAPEG family protein [Rhizorhapis sp. SPR117]